MDLESLSDHRYVSFTIQLDVKIRTIRHKKKYIRWSYKKMDEECFKEALTWRCINFTRRESIDEKVNWIQDAITDACNYSMTIATPIRKESVYWSGVITLLN